MAEFDGLVAIVTGGASGIGRATSIRLAAAGARVFVELVRPVEKRAPLAVAMEAADIGRFAGHVDLPERGNWDLDILVERGSERYAVTRRMFLR